VILHELQETNLLNGAPVGGVGVVVVDCGVFIVKMMGYRSKDKVDEFGLYLFTRFLISLGIMCGFRKQTFFNTKMGLN
jgi:hypothetical protein